MEIGVEERIPAERDEWIVIITIMAEITRNCFRRCGESRGSFIVSS